MKATNHPSDKMTIKNNNGDLLLEIDAEGVQSIKFKDGNEITGKDISDAVAKAGYATKVEANPTLAGTEAALAGLQVGETKYKVEQPINVVANPTLAGTEAVLAGLQVGETKYKVDGVNIIHMDCDVSVSGGDFTVACLSQETFENSTVAMAAVADIGEKALTGKIPLIVIHVTNSTVSAVTEGDIFVATYAETSQIGGNTLVFFSLLAPADAYMSKWQLCFARPDGTTGSEGSIKFTMTFRSTLSA